MHHIRLSILLLAALFAPSLACNLDQRQPTTQDTKQDSQQETGNTQDQSTQGSYVNVYNYNYPKRGDAWLEWDDSTEDPTTRPTDDSATVGGLSQDNGTAFAQARATNINITYIQTGGTTPSVTGTATGTQTPGQSVASTAGLEGRLDPRTSLQASIPIAWAGGLAQAEGRSVGPDATTGDIGGSSFDGTVQYLRLKAQGDLLARIAEEWLKTMQKPPPADDQQPGTDPNGGGGESDDAQPVNGGDGNVTDSP